MKIKLDEPTIPNDIRQKYEIYEYCLIWQTI